MVQGLLNGTPNITSIAKQGISGASAAGAVASGGANIAASAINGAKADAAGGFKAAGGNAGRQ